MLKKSCIAACLALFAAGCNTSQTSTSTSGSSTGKSSSSSSGGTNGTSGTNGNPTNGGSTTGNPTNGGSTTGNPSTGSGGTSGNPTGSGSGSTGSSAGTTTSGSTGGSTGGFTCDATVADVATLRASTPTGTNACLNGLVTVYASSYGSLRPDGGTDYDGRYLMADSNGNGIVVYKTKKSGALTLDPSVGANVNVHGDLEYSQYPYTNGQLDLGDIARFMDIAPASTTTAIPTPDTITDVANIADSTANTQEIGRLVTVPAGTYTQDNAPAELTATIGGTSYVDGIALTDGNGHRILVDTYDFKHAGSQSCFPGDGGFPDLSAGNFVAFADSLAGGDGQVHKALYLANCGRIAAPSGTCTTIADVATLRANPPVGDNVCLKGLVTVYASSYGSTTADGGTQFDGRYLVADSNGDGIVVYKTKKAGPLTLDPMVGANVDVRGDLDYNQYPYSFGQLDLGDIPAFMDITPATTTTAVPTPDTVANVADISDDVTNTHEIGRLVTVPAGTYTQSNTPAELTATIGTNTFVDGVSLTDTSGNKILVDTFDFKHAGSSNCFPADGGSPDLSAGNFTGFVDNLAGGDGNNHKAVYLANCGQ